MTRLKLNDFESLRGILLEEKQHLTEILCSFHIEEPSVDFYRMEHIKGQIRGISDAIEIIRNVIKYGDGEA